MRFGSKAYWQKNYWKAGVAVLLAVNLFLPRSLIDLANSVSDQLANKVNTQQSGPSLREAAKKQGKLIGIATQSWYLNDKTYSSVVEHNFNILTAEYQMKIGQIQPQRGAFNFTEADKIVDYAEKNDMLVRGHALVWHQSLPDWITSGQYSRDEWIEILRDHITTTVSHFKGRIYAWDVVNEAFYQNGDYRPSIWYTNIGPEYIDLAFQFAHEADPNAKLFYNDFDTEVANPRSDAIFGMVKSMKQRGIPIDGVGFQTHLKIPGVNYELMKQNLNRFGKLGVDTDITEFDVITHTFDGAEQNMLEAQADVYRNIMDVVMDTPSVKSIVIWGLKDNQSWLPNYTGQNEYPLLFDNSYNSKPAYTAFLEKLEGIE
ncbi:endo-1,4-beta-xylanase [Cohnella sp. AR92]|uniref:endo-1,4-beta-xylanase n=1 Tax=Cohnella sp. AR92 TaxID=648716 RepID=UPI000F8CF227|nr:endo-1,4-beta-xylanase [Cohnella sp. AR92]RUS42605.1 endo-1,4-beta-xylanase [Cohnella sp. AR92]